MIVITVKAHCSQSDALALNIRRGPSEAARERARIVAQRASGVTLAAIAASLAAGRYLDGPRRDLEPC